MSTSVKAGRTVRDLPTIVPTLHRCKRYGCSRDFGGYRIRQLPGLPWQLVDGSRWFRPEDRPRTGTGLSAETYEGVDYVRIRCKCGRNEKLRLEKYLALPVVEESAGPVVSL